MIKRLQREHTNVYLSLSQVINTRSIAHESLIRAASATRLLVESDYNAVNRLAPQTWDMVVTIARIKGWTVEESEYEIDHPAAEKGVVGRLEQNWEAFVKGEHPPGLNRKKGSRESGKVRKRNKFPHAEEDWESDGDDAGKIIGGTGQG